MYLSILLSLFFLVSCLPSFKKGEFKFQETVTVTPALGPETAAFTELREKILEPHCINCHQHSSYRFEKEFQKRIRPGKGEASRKYLSVVEGKMPKDRPKLSQEQADMIKNYINGIKTPDRGSYVEFKKVLNRNKCLGCHTHGMWENEEEIRKVIKPGFPEESRLYQMIVDKKMPPPPTKPDQVVVPVSDEDLEIIKAYIMSLKEEELPKPSDDGEIEGTPASSVGQDPPTEL